MHTMQVKNDAIESNTDAAYNLYRQEKRFFQHRTRGTSPSEETTNQSLSKRGVRQFATMCIDSSTGPRTTTTM